jgi:menaquinone-dependent protoporphyrinogen oxidase
MHGQVSGGTINSTMRVLVTAATRHDSTVGIAHAIADGLSRRSIDAEMLPIACVSHLSGYNAVVLGSAVYLGRWMREAVSFIGANSSRLAAIPVWLFSSGPLGPPERPIPSTDPADVAEMIALTDAREHRVFGGRLDRSQLGIAERAMVKAAHARYGDDRDWDAIDRFAADIAAALAGVSAHG